MRVTSFFQGISLGAVLGVCLLVLSPSPAKAIDSLSYDFVMTGDLLAYIENDGAAYGFKNLEAAAVDLNEDGITEYIIRSKDCELHALCAYHLLAETAKGYRSLGELRARTLKLGHNYTHGVRNLLLFTNELNDFDYKMYVWNAAQFRYTLKSDG